MIQTLEASVDTVVAGGGGGGGPRNDLSPSTQKAGVDNTGSGGGMGDGGDGIVILKYPINAEYE